MSCEERGCRSVGRVSSWTVGHTGTVSKLSIGEPCKFIPEKRVDQSRSTKAGTNLGGDPSAIGGVRNTQWRIVCRQVEC